LRYIRSYIVGLTLVLSQTAIAWAQGVATAQLWGMVTDPSGAVVVHASVTARDTATGFTRSTQSTDSGYILTGLPPGTYAVTVEAKGFASLEAPKVELTVGQQATLDLALQVAGTRETITVNLEPSAVEPTRTGLSQVIAEREIEHLPINGRQFLDFVLLTPNVDSGRSALGNQVRPGEPDQIDISFTGLNEVASSITVDGANNINRFFQRSRSAPSQEAVREFRVLNAGFSAEYGMAAGGVVNIVTKSGTNQMHGSGYYFLRNNVLDAHNILAPQGFDELRQNQFGGTLGGPIIKARLFLFGNYEGQRRAESPSYSTVLLNNIGPINAVKRALGLPSERLEGKLRQLNYDSVTVRSDYQARASDQLALIYRFRNDRDTNLNSSSEQLSAPSNFRNAHIRDNTLVGDWTSTHGTSFINKALFQYARHSFDFPSVSFEPFLQIGNTLNLGRAAVQPDLTRETMLEFTDAVTYLHGGHTMKFGGGINYTRDFLFLDAEDPAFVVFPNLNAFLGTPPFPPRPFAVVFSYRIGPDGTRPPAPTGFARPANQGVAIFDQLSRANDSQNFFSLYAQDEWRATPRLMLNYGLRWDVDHLPKAAYETYYKAFQPRVGLAYNMLPNRLVLRAGAGVYQGVFDLSRILFSRILGQNPALGPIDPAEYNSYPGALFTPQLEGPVNALPAFLNFTHTGIYPTLIGPGLLPAHNFFLTLNRKNPRGLYTYQWNAQVECSITKDTVLSLSYVGVHGLNAYNVYLLNVAPALFKLPNGMNDYSIAPPLPVPRVFNREVSPLALFSNPGGQSIYHGGTLALTKRLSHFYSFTANYTWSKVIDNTGNQTLSDAPEDPYRLDLEGARSKQDVTHRFVANLTAEGPERTWLRGFRFSLVGNVSSPQYYTLYAGSDVNHDGNSLSDRVGLLGRNTYRGDGLVNLDIRLSRLFRLTERAQLEALAEAFNLFNTLNVTDINTVYGAANFIGPEPRSFNDKAPAPSPDFGAIRAIAPPRQIQFAVRLNF
jgi:Carboxypeptidase regulatory-like domain/TonB dependent receptor